MAKCYHTINIDISSISLLKDKKLLIILLTSTLNKKIILETNEKICNHILRNSLSTKSNRLI
ncbi:hypothetical protein [Borreliella garinii]|uniref:hypothetical protein n=1 Tax=Borreliella garinii TaxID=29519 RepID=UPI001AEF91F1|nr:hypothetical protein [Borreliella garinii]